MNSTEVEREAALGQKDQKRRETGRKVGCRGDKDGYKEQDILSDKDRDREQDKVIQREGKGTGRQNKVKGKNKMTGSRTEI